MSKKKQKDRRLKKTEELRLKKLAILDLDLHLPRSKKQLYINFYALFCKQFPTQAPINQSRANVKLHLSKIPGDELQYLVFLHWISYFTEGGPIDDYMELYGQKTLYDQFLEYISVIP